MPLWQANRQAQRSNRFVIVNKADYVSLSTAQPVLTIAVYLCGQDAHFQPDMVITSTTDAKQHFVVCWIRRSSQQPLISLTSGGCGRISGFLAHDDTERDLFSTYTVLSFDVT
eukprot:scaffold59766_cov16-Prasinocladus_malaysianus.AAC.2